jgi:pyruvate dehydrogenase E1 component beta subunit
MTLATMRTALRDALAEEMRRDPSIVYLGEDLACGGIFSLVDGLAEEFGSDRIIPTPISEAGFVAAALGMAMSGLRPIVEIMWADLLLCAADPIINGIAKAQYKSGGTVSVPLVIVSPQGGGVGHGNNQSQCMEGLYGHLPGLKIVCPGNIRDARGLYKTAIRDPDPVIVFLPTHYMLSVRKGLPTEDLPEQEYLVAMGEADVKRSGTDVTVATWGNALPMVLTAADEVAQASGIAVEVVDLRSLCPMDIGTVVRSAHKTRRLVIAYEAHTSLGFGAEIAARVQHALWDRLVAPIERVGALDVPIPAALEIEATVLPNSDKVVAAIRRSLS